MRNILIGLIISFNMTLANEIRIPEFLNLDSSNKVKSHKIGIVDMEYVLLNISAVKEMNKKLEKKLKIEEDKLISVEIELKEKYKEMVNDSKNLSQEEVKHFSDEYNNKVTEYQLALRQRKAEIDKIRRENLNKISEAFNLSLKKVAESKDLSVILYKSQLVAYIDPDLDISEDVLKIMTSRSIKLNNLD